MDEPTLGVVFRPQSPPERLREVVVAAEQAGVPELWLWEDCFLEGGLTAAAAALAWTERLRVGVGLLPVPLRNPALAAMEIATLARMFPGRFLPGIGHGVLDWMAQVGEGAASPMTLLREYTTAVRDLLHGRTVDVSGRYVQLAGVGLDWPPDDVPPVYVGARGPRTIRLAGELADGVILDGDVTADGVRAAAALLAQGRAAAGRDGRALLVAYTPLAEPTRALVEQRAAELGTAGADTVVFLAPDPDAPDPRPLIAACAATDRSAHTLPASRA